MSLITDSTKVERMNLLSTESFQETFGPGKQRKRYVENGNWNWNWNWNWEGDVITNF